MPDYIKYSKSIGKALSNAASTIRDDDESYDLLESLRPYISCKGFMYEKPIYETSMRAILLKLWSRLLLMLKTAHLVNQNNIFSLIACIMTRSEFLLENCGFEDSTSVLDPEIRNQLIQYIFFLKLSLLYTPRAIVTHMAPAREFVFTTISASIIRIPEYRVCFFTQLQELIHSASVSIDAGIESTPFTASASYFITKYLDPHLLKGELVEESTTHFSNSSEGSSLLLPSTQSLVSRNSSQSECDIESSMTDETTIDMISMVANLPPAYTNKNDMIVFHDDSDSTYYKKREDFCYDDHNFDIVSIEDDHCENPYSTMNIQDILRTQRYSNTTDGRASSYTDSLPPLKLPNMNVVVDMLYEKYSESVEEHLRTEAYIKNHPSLFDWDSICKEQTTQSESLLNQTSFKSNDEEEASSVNGQTLPKETIGDLYLDTQVISLFGRNKPLLSQFITFYMRYIRSFHSSDEVIVWQAIPGYFLFMRLFLIHFQEFFMSKLSSGILRMNFSMERIIKDSIAYSLCDTFVIDGEILNYVMSILFDKCNVNVFLDISKSLMVLHNLLKAIRDDNSVVYYHSYPRSFYEKVYSSKEIKLLLRLQKLNKNANGSPNAILPPSTPLSSSPKHSLSPDGDLDLPTLDAMSHTNHYYNNNLSFIYTATNAFDLLYETTIDSTIRSKSVRLHTHSTKSNGSYGLHRMPSEWMKKKDSEDKDELTVIKEIPTSIAEETLPSILETEVGVKADSTEYGVQNTSFFMSTKVEGFTILQAIQFLIDNDIITSRGEGLDFFSILQDRRIIEPYMYERRFRTTIYHVIALRDLRLFTYPEISLYNHSYFEDRINYVYFLYVLKGLIKMPHVQIIEKVLTFIYFNEDFFSGKHRLQLYCEIIFPNFSLFFTHWNANVRHIFHRLLIYKMFRTRLSYLPRYSSLEIQNELYNRIFEHKKELRKKGSFQQDIIEEENENNVFSYDKESQQGILDHFSYDFYVRSKTPRAIRQRANRIATCLKLCEYRETQSVDVTLAERLKVNLHLLMNVNQFPNQNTTNGKSFIPSNQFRYFWISLLEYSTLLEQYEDIEMKAKPKPIYRDNIYHDGIGNVEDTEIPWTLVNEMESRISDSNSDIELFLAHKN